MSSILTNNGAMVALQTLRATNGNLNEVQQQIATGKRVATAKDDASNWAIASTMQSDIASFNRLSKSLGSAEQMVSVASNAAEQIAEKLIEAQELVTQAQNPDADTAKIDEALTAITETIASIAESAQYNGINFVGSAAATETITTSVMRDAAGTLTTETLTVTGVDISTFAIDSTTTLDDVDSMLDTVNVEAAKYGSIRARIEAQNDFLKSQADALKSGVGSLVDADMEEASARLQALQVQQQLGTQALSIANQAPQNLLALFR